MQAGYIYYFFLSAAQFVLLSGLFVLFVRFARQQKSGSPFWLGAEFPLLLLTVSGLVWDNLRVAAAGVTGDEEPLKDLACAAYVWHEAVAPFHYILPLLLALRLDDGTVTRKWITRYLLPMLSLFSMALTGYGIYFAVRTNCPTIAITEAPGGTIVAESKGGFDPAIAHLFLGTILYILLGSCFWKRARQWQFGLAQAILLPLFAAVPASKVYAFWLGNLWEVVWSASFVGLEVWLDKKGAEGWICVRRGKEMGLEAEERGVPKPGQDELINGGRDISAITGITVAEREQV